MPMPVIQTRRRCGHVERFVETMPLDSTASASAANVDSVRPAIGRVNQRSTNAAKPGMRRREVVLDGDAAPRALAVRLDAPGHVHALGGARRRWTKRSRDVVGLVQVRERHVTGQRQPEQRHERPAGDEVDDERAVGAALHDPGARRSGGAGSASARRPGPGRRRWPPEPSTSMPISLCTSGHPLAQPVDRVACQLAESEAGGRVERRASDRCRSSRRARRAGRRR